MSQLQSILAIETSTVACSVALLHEGLCYERFEILPQKHAHRALEMVDEVLLEAGIEGDSIDLLAYGEGPGAFTGVRIASGVIQGLALGWDKPVVGISSLEAMAEHVMNELQADSKLTTQSSEVSWCALMDARMKEVYMLSGSFNPETACWTLGETLLISPEIAKDKISAIDEACIGLGDIQKEYPELAGLFNEWLEVLPSANAIANIAKRRCEKGLNLDEAVPLPIYLRNHIADTIEERKLKAAQKALG